MVDRRPDAASSGASAVPCWDSGASRTSSVRASGYEKILRAVPDSRFIIYSRTGHWAMIEQAEDFNRNVIEFLKADAIQRARAAGPGPRTRALPCAARANDSHAALRDLRTDLQIDDAYAISLGILERRQRDGERRRSCEKIGVTSKPGRTCSASGSRTSDFLTDRMWIPDGGTVGSPKSDDPAACGSRESALIPCAAGSRDLGDARGACSRRPNRLPHADRDRSIHGSRRLEHIRIIDTVADSASCGVFVLGAARVDPRPLRSRCSEGFCWLYKNGQHPSDG